MSTLTAASSQELTVENVVSILRCVPTTGSSEHSTTWRYLPYYWKRAEWAAVGVFSINYRRFVKITEVCSTEEEELCAVVRFWLVVCPLASWRWLIWKLDGWCQFELADQIREFAEPLTDPSLTYENVSEIVNTVNQRLHLPTMEYCLSIPINKRTTFNMCLSSSDHSRMQELVQYRDTLVRYWVSCVPFASWENLAGRLYRCKEKWALDLIEKHLTPPDSSLTLRNVSKYQRHLARQLRYGSISEWFNLTNLDLPSRLSHTNSGYTTYCTEKYVNQIVKQFLYNHPSPTWNQVAYVMYMSCLYRDAVHVRKHYIDKDVSSNFTLQNQCISKIASFFKNPEHVNSLPLPASLQSSVIHQIIVTSL